MQGSEEAAKSASAAGDAPVDAGSGAGAGAGAGSARPKPQLRLPAGRMTPVRSGSRRRLGFTPSSPVPWPNLAADFVVSTFEPPRRGTVILDPTMHGTLAKLAPLVGAQSGELAMDRVLVKQIGPAEAPGVGINIKTGAEWEGAVRGFWGTRVQREEGLAINRIKTLLAEVLNGVSVSHETKKGVSAVFEAVNELWMWTTRKQLHRHMLSLGIINILSSVLDEPALVAPHAVAVAILCAFAREEVNMPLFGQGRVLEHVLARVQELHAVRREKEQSRRSQAAARAATGAGRGGGDGPAAVKLTSEGVSQHLDYCTAALLNTISFHASGRALVYSHGPDSVRLLELLIGSRELATASLAMDALCELTAHAKTPSWYPRYLFRAYNRSWSQLASSRIHTILDHIYEWVSPEVPDEEYIHIELAAAAVTNTMALTPAGIRIMRASNLLPSLARIWTRVNERVQMDILGEVHTTLGDVKAALSRGLAGSSVAAASRAASKMAGRRRGKGQLSMALVTLASHLKSGKAKEKHEHEQRVMILEFLSAAIWGCCVGGVEEPEKHDAQHWSSLDVCRLGVMMLDHNDSRIARAGMGILANVCSFPEVKPADTDAGLGTSRLSTARGGRSTARAGLNSTRGSRSTRHVTMAADGRPGSSRNGSGSGPAAGSRSLKKCATLPQLTGASAASLGDGDQFVLGETPGRAGGGGRGGGGRGASGVAKWKTAAAPLYDHVLKAQMPRATRMWMVDHGCRSLMRRAREESHELRSLFIAVSSVNHLAATGGRPVKAELWRCGAGRFLLEAMGQVYERMEAAAAAKDLDDAMHRIEEGDEESDSSDEGKHKDMGGRKAVAKPAPKPSILSRSKRPPVVDTHYVSKRTLDIRHRAAQVRAGSSGNLPQGFRDMNKRRKKGPLPMDETSKQLLRRIASSLMYLGSCYGTTRPREVVEAAVCLLKHHDPEIVRYGVVAVWALAHDRRNRRDAGDCGAILLLIEWCSALLITAAGDDMARHMVQRHGGHVPSMSIGRTPVSAGTPGGMGTPGSKGTPGTKGTPGHRTPASVAASVKAGEGKDGDAKVGDGAGSEAPEVAPISEEQRDRAAEILSLSLGCLWLLCCGTDDNVSFLVECHGMELLQDVLKHRSNHPRLVKPIHIALGFIWTLSQTPRMRTTVLSEELELPELVFDMVVKPEDEHGDMDSTLRVRSAGFLLDVLRDKMVKDRLGHRNGGSSFMEELWSGMLVADEAAPREYAIRTIARSATTAKAKIKLLKNGGVRRLVDFLHEFAADPLLRSDSLMLALLHGILNLSTEPAIQRYLGKRALDVLMEIVEDRSNAHSQAFASRILLNLKQNSVNTSKVYIKELRSKAKSWKRSSQEYVQPVPRPPLGKSPFDTFSRPDMCTQFVSWFEDSISDPHSLPYGHRPGSIAFMAHNSSPWMERSALSLPSVPGSVSSTMPRPRRRETAATFQRTMCSHIRSIWTNPDEESTPATRLGGLEIAPALKRSQTVSHLSHYANLAATAKDGDADSDSDEEVPRPQTADVTEQRFLRGLPPVESGGTSTKSKGGHRRRSSLVEDLAAATAASQKVGTSSSMTALTSVAFGLKTLKKTAVHSVGRAVSHQARLTEAAEASTGGHGHGGSRRSVSSMASELLAGPMASVLEASGVVKPRTATDGQTKIITTFVEAGSKAWAPHVHSYEVSEGVGRTDDPSDPTVPVTVVLEPRSTRHRVTFPPAPRAVAFEAAAQAYAKRLANETKEQGAQSDTERAAARRRKKRAQRDRPWRKRPPLSPLHVKPEDRVRRTSEESLHLPPPRLVEPSVRLARFEHVPGCRVCEGMYKHYTLPDGRSMHYYHNDRLSELVLDTMVEPPSYPLAASDIGLLNGLPPPPSAVRPVTVDVPDSYEPSVPIGAPQPSRVSLPEEKHLEFEITAVAVQKEEEAKSVHVVEKEWSLYDSVFARRLKESYNKDFYDQGRCKDDAFEVDWGRVMSKRGVARVIVKAGLHVGTETHSEDNMAELKALVKSYYGMLCSVFDFLAVLGDGFNFAIRSNAYYEFLAMCDLPEDPAKGGNPHVHSREFGILFEQVTYQDKHLKESNANVARMMMRFEFLEMLLRVCIAKYMMGGDDPCSTVADAFERMIKTNLLDNHLPPEALYNKDEFRRERMYNYEVDQVLRKFRPFLRRIWNILTEDCKFKNKKRALDIDGWQGYLARVGVLDSESMFFSTMDAQLAFTWSKMDVKDELADQFDWVTLTFTDFMEALCRVADTAAIPTDDDLKTTAVDTAFEFFTELRPKPELRRASAGNLLGKKERPLHGKLHKFLDFLIPMSQRAYKDKRILDDRGKRRRSGAR